MTDGFTCTDKETLVAYVYGECEAAERRLVEAHLTACAACAEEVAGLQGVRSALGAWTVTAPETGVRLVAEPTAAPAPPAATVLRPTRWWQAPLPALGRLAAAILLFAGGAAIANLEVRYDENGFAVRTGWWREAPAAPSEAAVQSPAPLDTAASPAPGPWRADLVSLERRLREEFGQNVGGPATRQAAAPAAALDDRAVMARVSELIAASEQRQQREMAYRMTEMFGELSAQRQNDLLRVQQGLGAIEGTTGAEVLRQRQLINYLLTVSEKR